MRAAKGEEIKLRNFNNGALWDKLFAEQPVISMLPDFGNTTSHEVEKFFCKMVDEKVDDSLVSRNLSIWSQTLQAYLFAKCGEDPPERKVVLGMIPAVVRKKVLRPTKGDITQLVLPGGGDFSSRIWAGIRRHVAALAKWCVHRAFDTPAFLHTKQVLENFVLR